MTIYSRFLLAIMAILSCLPFHTIHVQIYFAHGNLDATGKWLMPGMVDAHVTNRTVMGNKVIDHEKLIINDKQVAEAIATYFVEGGRISKVFFIDSRQ